MKQLNELVHLNGRNDVHNQDSPSQATNERVEVAGAALHELTSHQSSYGQAPLQVQWYITDQWLTQELERDENIRHRIVDRLKLNCC